MGVNVRVRDAFVASREFNDQVNFVMVREMLYKVGDPSSLVEPQRSLVASISRSPSTYGFPSTIVNDNAWDVGYDTWASDPEAQDGTIASACTKYFTMLTGMVLPEPAP